MSSNRVSNTIECYMDELIECFEDFVKKSLIILTVGLAAVVGLLLYLMKVLSDRPPCNVIPEGVSSAQNPLRNTDTEGYKNQERIFYNSKLTKRSKTSLDKASSCNITAGVNTVSSFTNTAPWTKNQIFDEKILRDVGLSSGSKLQSCERTNSHSHIPCRVPVPCLSLPKRKSAHAIRPDRSKQIIPSKPVSPKSVTKRDSCCSICCDDEE